MGTQRPWIWLEPYSPLDEGGETGTSAFARFRAKVDEIPFETQMIWVAGVFGWATFWWTYLGLCRF